MAKFIPPMGGVFRPNSADISSWLYQIWQYLQDNPIANVDELRTLIADTLPAEVATAVAEYLEEHPVEVDYPVDSVNGRTGAVTIQYAELVNGTSLPVYYAANDEIGPNDLLEAYAEGCRFVVVDADLPNPNAYVMYKEENTVTLIPLGGGGGGSGDGIASINNTIYPVNGNATVNGNNLPIDATTNAATIKATIEARPTMAQIVNTIYPIGSIYISTAAADPSTLFTGTQWEAIQDRFLLADGTVYTAGATGGTPAVTLTAAQMPIHKHNFDCVDQNGNPSTPTGVVEAMAYVGQGNGTSTISTNGTLLKRSVMATAGEGQAHDNMPPYLVVHMWKRKS